MVRLFSLALALFATAWAHDDRISSPPAPTPPAPPAPLGPMTIQLDAWGSNSIRIRVAPKDRPIAEPPIGALLPEAPANSISAVRSKDGHTMTHGNLRVDVDPATGLIAATRVSDNVLLLNQTSLTFAPCGVSEARDGSVEATVKFAGLEPGELVSGLGEHGRPGHGDQKVRRSEWKRTFADSLTYDKSQGGDVSIPMYMSTKGYTFVWNSPALGSVDIGASQLQWQALATLGVDMWISTTPSSDNAVASPYPSLLRQYADAVGHALPMPSYTTGFIQCKDRYRNQTQVLDVARGYKQRGLPISMIVIDWFHWKEMGDFGFKEECWPDPQAMVDELRSLDIELMVTLWPYVGHNVSRHWEEYSTNGYLGVNISSGESDSFWQFNTPTGNSIIDPSNPRAMNATGNHWYEGYGKYGIRAIWMDQSEPDHHVEIGGKWKFHDGTDTEMLPAWVKYWGQGFSKELEAAGHKPGEYFILSRNAWAGTQASGMALWSGDIESNWDELEAAVTIGQGVGLSGIPLWTTDIGGYSGGDPASADFQELIVRWFQFGAFCPLFRLHGHRSPNVVWEDAQCGRTHGDNEVWNLAQEPAHYDAIVAVMKLRETLRPYVKQLNDESVSDGMPMMRAMFLEFPDDEACNDGSTDAQYMFGSDWLIAPVTTAKAATWPAYLPALPMGECWEYWWNHTSVPQFGWVSIDTSSIGHFPLFRRAPVPEALHPQAMLV